MHRPAACLIAGLITAGCPAGPASDAAAGGKKPARVTLVEVATARAGTIQDRWRFTGDVRAKSRSTLAAGASGSVKTVTVREGDRVRAGKLLVQIDPALARARLRVAEAALEGTTEALAQAQRERNRLDKLARNVVPEIDIERTRSRVLELTAALAAGEAAVAEAMAQLHLHRVEAPFAGVVADRRVHPGEWVRPGDPVLELVSTEGLEVIVEASAKLFDHVKRGDVATLLGARTSSAAVTGVVPALDPVARTLKVRLRPQVDDLLPGTPVEVEFAVALGAGGVVVPIDALVAGPTETKVVMVQDGAAVMAVVAVHASGAGEALVSGGGLDVGAVVVVRGNERLRPGQSVKVKD